MSIAIDTARDLDSGVATVRVDGELTFATAPIVRSALDACAGEYPTAIIADLTGLDVVESALLTVFVTASQRASEHCGVLVLLCGARPDFARRIRAFRTVTDVYDSHAQALDALRAGAFRWRCQRLPPEPSSAALARALVATACLDWDLPALGERATLVASELASNAIEHAGTDLRVTVSYTGIYLRVGVQDGSPVMPELITHQSVDPAAWHRGRGLHVVKAVTGAWCTVAIPAGKIVSAVLTVHPVGSPYGDEISSPEYPYGHDAAEPLAIVSVGRHDHTAAQSLLVEALSHREIEVLRYLPTELNAGEIAADMHVSVNTVKAHLRSIYRKLGVKRRHDAVIQAYEHGLLS